MKGGLLCKKKEMTRLWVDGKFVPVTLLAISPQHVVRYKTTDVDGYDAVVVGADPRSKATKGTKQYTTMVEFDYDSSFADAFAAGSELSADVLADQATITVSSISKGKGYQGGMKRFGLKGGPKTHGSKFHRQIGSLGNRKPRRVLKGHPHAGHMGTDRVTLHRRDVIDTVEIDGQTFVAVKGSVPGGRNSYVHVITH
jgi:large subunit ribosomal protein L3